MSKLIEKIEQKLVELGVVKLAEEEVAETGTTETKEIGSVIISEIIPTPIDVTYSAIGAPVIVKNEAGEEENLGDGEYFLKDDMKMVIVDGKLKELIKIEEVEEEIELSKVETKTEEVKTEVELAETKTEEVKTEVELAETKTDTLELATNVKSLLSGIDMTKAGSYWISITVSDSGEITYATVSSEIYQNLLLSEEKKVNTKVDELTQAFELKQSKDKEKYEGIIDALKSGTGITETKEPVVEPVKLTRTEILKAQIQEKRNANK